MFRPSVYHSSQFSASNFSRFNNRRFQHTEIFRPSSTTTIIEGTINLIPPYHRGLGYKEAAARARDLSDTVQAVKVEDMLKEKPRLLLDVEENKSVFQAIKIMSKNNVGCLPLKDSSSNMHVGMFTETDYREKLILKDRSSKNTRLDEVETTNLVCVTPSFTLGECANLMISKNIRHLPVVTDSPEDALDGDHRIIGVISSKDLVQFLIKSLYHSRLDLDFTIGDVFDSLARRHTSDFFLEKDRSVFEALVLMSRHNVSSVVIHESNSVIGIFTERDYLHKVALKNRSSKDTILDEVMTKHVISVPASTLISEALNTLIQNNIRSLPILPVSGTELNYSDQEPLGLATEMDIIDFVMREAHLKDIYEH